MHVTCMCSVLKNKTSISHKNTPTSFLAVDKAAPQETATSQGGKNQQPRIYNNRQRTFSPHHDVVDALSPRIDSSQRWTSTTRQPARSPTNIKSIIEYCVRSIVK